MSSLTISAETQQALKKLDQQLDQARDKRLHGGTSSSRTEPAAPDTVSPTRTTQPNSLAHANIPAPTNVNAPRLKAKNLLRPS